MTSCAYHLQHLEGAGSSESGCQEPARPVFSDAVQNSLNCRIAQLESVASELIGTLSKLNANLEAVKAEVANLQGKQAQHAESSSDQLTPHLLCEQGQFRSSSSDALPAPVGFTLHAPSAPSSLPAPSTQVVTDGPWFESCRITHGEGQLGERHCSFPLPITVRLRASIQT